MNEFFRCSAPAGERRVLLALSAITTLSFLVWVLWFCQYGVDFRDEGFYFNWMADPFKYTASVTQFGFIYHSLFMLVQEDIAAIRQLNLLITFSLAWALADRALALRDTLRIRGIARLAIAGAMATASLSFLHIWLPTPSYNWLALQGLMVASIGLFMIDKVLDRKSIAGATLLAVGGWLTFMAKPTSAAGLAACTLLYLIGAGRFSWRALVISSILAVLLLVGSAWVIDGSIHGFVQRYRSGIEMAGVMMGSSNKISVWPRLGLLQLDPRTRNSLIGACAALVMIGRLAGSESKAAVIVSTAGLWLLCVGALFIMFGFARTLVGTEYYRGLLLMAVPFAGMLLASLRRTQVNRITRARWSAILMLIALPVVYVLGTANDNWWQISHAAIFWVIAGALLATPGDAEWTRSASPALLSVALGAQLITVAIVQSGIEAPYGQAIALRDDHHETSVGRPSTTLRLSPGFGAYLTDATEVARRAGFHPGTAMLDLTGRSPTTLFAMRASSTSQPWVIGGYPGSDKLALAMLKRVSCDELAGAWLLIQPIGSTGISATVLSEFGADLEADYEKAGTIVMSERFSGYPEVWTQYILKPTRQPEVARAACIASRSAQP